MAGKDYNHLFKLLIIGDSSQWFSFRFRFKALMGCVVFKSFSIFSKPRSLLREFPQCCWPVSFLLPTVNMQLLLHFKPDLQVQPFAFMTTAAGHCGMDHSETMTISSVLV